MSPVATTPNNIFLVLKDKPILSVLLAFALFSAGLTLIITAITPKNTTAVPPTELMSGNFDDSTTTFKGVRYTGSAFNTPEQLFTARYQVSPIAAEQITQSLVERYALAPIAQSQNILVNDVHSLFRDQKNEEFTFSIDTTQLNASKSAVVTVEDFQTKKIINQDQALLKAQEFINQQLPEYNYRPIPQLTKYFSADRMHLDEVNQSNADIVEIQLAPYVDRHPIYLDRSEYPPVRLMLDREYQVVKFIYQFSLFTAGLPKKIDPISVETAITNINSGVGSIVSAYQDRAQPIDLEEASDVELTQVAIEYRVDTQSGLVLPVYKFTGTAISTYGEKMRIQVITPAAKTVGQNQ